MKQHLAFSLVFFNVLCGNAQISNVQEEFDLPNTITESSGAIYVDKKLVTHNDSGGQNELYEVTLDTETISRIITISNATNVDWEDVAQDDTYIYIGDFGNNNGTRTDLKIYKILKSDFNSSTSITAEVINFSYADQSDFTSNPQNTVWDAEALISLNANELVLISKNWVDGISSAYLISKTPGTYAISAQSTTLSTGGLITGATFNELSNKLFLSGYTQTLSPFVWVCEDFTGSTIFSGTNTQTMLSSLVLEQIEGITHTSVNEYLITSESFSFMVGSIPFADNAKVVSFATSDTTLSAPEERESRVTLYPNPVSNKLHIQCENLSKVEVFNIQSALLFSGNIKQVDMNKFSAGIYLVKVNFYNNTSVIERVVKR